MNIVKEFSRFATSYNDKNIIQKLVAQKLLKYLNLTHYNSVLDLGCGGGEIYKNMLKNGISFDKFIGVDISQEMLNIHPKSKDIELICSDFEDINIKNRYDIVVSSSALQWSQNLDNTLLKISKLSNKSVFAIFTSDTFKTLHNIAGISSPIYPKDYLITHIDRYFNAQYESVKYKLEFENTYKMLEYIKKSGVSGGERKLSLKEIKNLIKSYPLSYLEFEVLFVECNSKLS